MASSATAVAASTTTLSQRFVTVGTIQISSVSDIDTNCRRAEDRIREAARKGANIVLVPELFASLYFPIDQVDCLHLSVSLDDKQSYISRFQSLARELNLVLPISFYERANNAYFNSVLVIDADGTRVGVYRKSHIPDGPGYQEKFYFSPGDTGFRVFNTRFATLGVGISSDQWYPEAARIMALQGAELLLYPTAIGSEPHDPAMDTCAQWQRCMQGHAASNMVPVIAANRVNKEHSAISDLAITFYGSSFMTDHRGGIVSDAGRHQEIILTHTYNLEDIRMSRYRAGHFRDRRPELYSLLCSYDGHIPHVVAAPNRRLSAASVLPNNTAIRMTESPSGVVPTSLPNSPFMTQASRLAMLSTDVGITSAMGSSAAAAVAAAAAAAAAAVANGANGVSLPGLVPGKKLETDALLPTHAFAPNIVDDPQQRVVNSTFDMHEASFIGEVKGNSQRRPRGRCWVCRAKTTYDCKLCVPGPVPLCNRTARECWWKYHAGEITPYVPNKRGRKRSKIESSPLVVAPATGAAARANSILTVPSPATVSVVPTRTAGQPSNMVDIDSENVVVNEGSDDVGDERGMHQESDSGAVGSLLS